MRIALLAPIAWRVPPRHYGPWEQFCSHLCEGLVARGHDVTLFATQDSLTAAALAGPVPIPYEEDPSMDVKVWECLHIASCFERAGAFDLIHNSFDFLPLTYSGLVGTPVVTTIHGFSSPKILAAYERYNGRTHYVSISDSDRASALDYAATVHHGIPIGEFEFSGSGDGSLLYFGRIHPDKGCVEAIEAARAADRRLVIAGIVQDEAYFREQVEPEIDGDRVSYIGPVGPARRSEVLGRASALLHLINFDEPFGYSVVEAMACGTPVVAVWRGSMPELIEDGVNGVLVEPGSGLRRAAEAVARAMGLDRSRVRATAVERFSVERMVAGYEAVYRAVLGGGD